MPSAGIKYRIQNTGVSILNRMQELINSSARLRTGLSTEFTLSMAEGMTKIEYRASRIEWGVMVIFASEMGIFLLWLPGKGIINTG